MPKDTFYRLPDEKRNRILAAARKEFFRVPYEEASINQIIKNAEIPRGSFYQYFEDKKDVFRYVISQQHELIMTDIHNSMIKRKGDVFAMIYDYVDRIEMFYQNDTYERIRSTLKDPTTIRIVNGMLCGEKIFDKMEEQLTADLLKYVNFDYFKVEDEEEKSYLLEILSAVLKTNLRKIYISSEEEKDVSETCEETRKRIRFLEKTYRK